MKFHNKTVIFLLFVFFTIFFSCKVNVLGDIEKIKDLRQSILSDTLNLSGLYPPTKVSAVVKQTENGAKTLLSWDSCSAAVKYQVFRAPDKGGVAGKWEQIGEVESCLFEDNVDLTKLGLITYHYAIKAVSSESTASSLSRSAAAALVRGNFDVTVTDLAVSDGDYIREVSFENRAQANLPPLKLNQNQSIRLSWARLSRVKFYRIYRLIEGKDVSTRVEIEHGFYPNPDDAVLQWFDSFGGTLPNKDIVYRYFVIPFNEQGVPGGGIDLFSKNKSDTGYLLPGPALNEVSLGLSTGGVGLKWNRFNPLNNTLFVGYYLLRSETRNDGYYIISPLLTATTTSFLDSSAASENGLRKSYYYKLIAVYGGDLVTLAGKPLRGYAVDSAALSIPSGHIFQASRGITLTSRGRYELRLAAIPNAQHYYIYSSKSEQGTPVSLVDFVPTSLPFSDAEFEISAAGNFYIIYWKPAEIQDNLYFRLSCSGGGNSYDGALSQAVKGRVLPAPTQLKIAYSQAGSRTLSWKGVRNLPNDSYQVLITHTVDGENKPINFTIVGNSIMEESYVVPSDLKFSSLYYRVVVISSENGKSLPSNIINDAAPPLFTDFTVERGAVDGALTLSWTVATGNEADQCQISRKAMGESASWAILTTTAAGVTSYDDNSAQVGGSYSYKINAIRSVDGITFSSDTSLSLMGYILSSPRNVNTSEGVTTLAVYWEAEFGATSYLINLKNADGSSQLSTATVPSAPSLSHTFNGLNESTSYRVEVFSKRADGLASQQAKVLNLTTRSSSDPNPVNITSISQGNFADHIQIQWEAYAGAQAYRISSPSTTAIVGWPIVLAGTSVNSSISAAQLGEIDSLLLTVEAQLPSSSWSPLANYVSGSLLTAPSSFSVSQGVFPNKIHLNWDAAIGSGLAQYSIETDSGSGYSVLTTLPVGTTSYDYLPANISTDAGKEIFFKVASVDSQSPATSRFSTTKLGWILPPAAAELKGSLDMAAINLKWPPVTHATHYKVYRISGNPASQSDWTVLTGIINNQDNEYSFSDYTALAGVVYFYKIQALGESGEGYLDFSSKGTLSTFIPFSPEITVTGNGVAGNASSAGTHGTSLTVNWANAVTGFPTEGYQYQLDYSVNGVAKSPIVVDATITSHLFENLIPGTPLSFRIRMKLGENQFTGDQADLKNRKTVAPILNGPLISAINGNEGASYIKINFASAASGIESFIASYSIMRCSQYNGNNSVWSNVGTVNDAPGSPSLAFIDNTLTTSGVYFYRVVSKNSDGILSNYYRKDVYACYFMPPVVGATATQRDPALNNRIRLSWQHAAGADSYDLYALFVNTNESNKILFKTDYNPSSHAAGSILNQDFNSWQGGHSIGAYHFWIEPKMNAHAHGWPATGIDRGPLNSYDIKGVREISNAEWINAIHSEMRKTYWHFKLGKDFDAIDAYDNTWITRPAYGCKLFRRYDNGWGRGLGNDANYLYDLFEFNHSSSSSLSVMHLTGSIVYVYAFAYWDDDYDKVFSINNVATPKASNKTQGWITITGDYPGKIFIHASALDCWRLGQAWTGVDANAQEQGNYIYGDCQPKKTYYQNSSSSTNANDSYLKNVGHTCPTGDFSDDDGQYFKFNGGISHFPQAFKIVRSPTLNVANIPPVSQSTTVSFANSGISKNVTWNGINPLNDN